MYLEHFQFKEKPFSIAPDPRFLFMSHRYKEALAHLSWGIKEGGGFVMLTGEVGTGKTTICRCLLQQLPDNTRLAFVLNPKLNSLELLATICDELNIDYPENCQSLKILTDKLSEYLLESYRQGLNVVVMIDEAQNLDIEVLEQIRLLTNLETNQKKLLQIILVGQPELQEKLALRELRQLAQRITARYHLAPLTLKESVAYILHRIRIAGARKPLFSRKAIEHLHQKTAGVPRLINTICERALLAAAARDQQRVEFVVMRQAVKEILGESPAESNPAMIDSYFRPWHKYLLAGLLILSLLFGAYYMGKNNAPSISSNRTETQSTNEQTSTTNSSQQNNEAKAVANDRQPTKPEINNSSKNIAPVTTDRAPSLVYAMQDFLKGKTWDTNGRQTMAALLQLWLIDYSPLKDGELCQFAASYGLQCFSGNGNWQVLREMNRPAAIKLSFGVSAGEVWVLLKSMSGTEAELEVDGERLMASLVELSLLWNGDYQLIWQAPEGYRNELKRGDKGIAVSWLVDKLNKQGRAPLSPRQNFDNEVEQALKSYQISRQIKADGIAGIQTILKLNQESFSGIPTLQPLG